MSPRYNESNNSNQGIREMTTDRSVYGIDRELIDSKIRARDNRNSQ